MNKLVGRERECQELKRAMESDRSEFVIVYGRRRVGKTFLVDQYYQGHYDFTFVGGHNLSRQRQLTSFARALKKLSGVKPDKFADWFDAFDALEEYLDSLDASRKKVVFIDEMPWIDTQKSDFVAALENFWNGWAARRSDIVFIASGFYSGQDVKMLFVLAKQRQAPAIFRLISEIDPHVFVRPEWPVISCYIFSCRRITV